ncbi:MULTISPECIES: hypothetical protein [Paenibacillus]|uniref:hypothetical protein n=1 Tax=Paenibacillus TaxID=44249 RepID=UPI00096FD15E|nr:hypothetical protein [Paenibacillus odorifer]OMD73602.1 hypothetical protein BSK50_22735 [Paenibacillus odorifer]
MEKAKILFNGELYDYEEFQDGSKRIHKKKNKRGFEIDILVSGDPEEHKKGLQAVEDFFVKGIL